MKIGKEEIRREGRDVKVMEYGKMVNVDLEDEEEKGVDEEVIDMRKLMKIENEKIMD